MNEPKRKRKSYEQNKMNKEKKSLLEEKQKKQTNKKASLQKTNTQTSVCCSLVSCFHRRITLQKNV